MIDERWLTLREAAERVGRTRRTIENWVQAGDVDVYLGHFRERDLLRCERDARNRRRNGWKLRCVK